MENEKIKVEKAMPFYMTRRQFMQLSAFGILALLAEKFGLKSEAAKNPEELYQSFINAFADGAVSTPENINNLRVRMGNLEQFLITDSSNNPFIYNYYKNCVAKKTKGNWSRFYSDASQKKFLSDCEDYLYHLTLNPNDEKVAKNFLNYVKDNVLEKKNSVWEIDVKTGQPFEAHYADFDPHEIKNVPVFETVCEIVQVAWEKIPAISKIRQSTKPEDMDDFQMYNCAQVIIDKCAGRTDTSDRNGHPRHSGITKGNFQTDELINLNYYAPNSEIQNMIARNLSTVLNEDGSRYYSDADIREILGLSENGYSFTLKK